MYSLPSLSVSIKVEAARVCSHGNQLSGKGLSCTRVTDFDPLVWESLKVLLFFVHILDVHPIIHAFTSGEDNEIVLRELENFEAEVRSLRASGGGDLAEYANRGMLEALDYTIIEDGWPFSPMQKDSQLIVITDAPSKEPELKNTIINKANEQGVSINFVLSRLNDQHYEDVARETCGVVYDDHHTTWDLVHQHFREKLCAQNQNRRKRSPPPSSPTFSVDVSVFTYRLRVSTLTPSIREGVAHVTLPNKITENVPILDSVMLYLRSNPQAGSYAFSVGTVISEVIVDQDIGLVANMLFLNDNFTKASFHPPPACKCYRCKVHFPISYL